MSDERVQQLTEAFGVSLSDYTSLLDKIYEETGLKLQAGVDHMGTRNSDHEVDKAQLGLSNILDMGIITPFELINDRGFGYTDLAAIKAYIESVRQKSTAIESNGVISPKGGEDIEVYRPILQGGYYLNVYGVERKHREFVIARKSDGFGNPTATYFVNSDSHQVDVDLVNLTDYIWRYRDVAENLDTSVWYSGEFTVQDEQVLMPVLEGPTDLSDLLLTPTFEYSDFQVNVNSDTHNFTTVRIIEKVSGDEVLLRVISTGDKTSFTVPASNNTNQYLKISTDYYIDVSYTGTNFGESAINRTEFRTTDGYIEQPIVNISDPVITGPVTFTSVWNGTYPQNIGNWSGTTLQISTTEDFSNLIVDKFQDTNNLITVNELMDNTQYWVRVRVYSDTGMTSAWSPVKTFTTAQLDGQATVIETSTSLSAVSASEFYVVGVNEGVGWVSHRDLIGNVTKSVKLSGMTTVPVGHCEYDGDCIVIGKSGDKGQIARISPTLDVVWIQDIEGFEPVSVEYHNTYNRIIVLGKGKNQSNQTLGITVLSYQVDGTVSSSSSLGSVNDDAIRLRNTTQGLYVVGKQVSNLGDNYTTQEAAALVKIGGNASLNNLVDSERYFGRGNQSVFYDCVTFGSITVTLGAMNGSPCLGTVTNNQSSTSNMQGNSLPTTHRPISMIGRDGSTPYVYLTTWSNGKGYLHKWSPSISRTSFFWTIEFDSVTDPMIILTNEGMEVVTTIEKDGKHCIVCLRVPESGTVNPIPYLATFNWTKTSGISLPGTTYWLLRDYTNWSNWTVYTTTHKKNSNSSSNRPSVTQSDLNQAEGYSNVSVLREVRSPTFEDPQYDTYSYYTWQTVRSESINYGTRGIKEPLGVSEVQSRLPPNTNDRRYVYNSTYSFLYEGTINDYRWRNRNFDLTGFARFETTNEWVEDGTKTFSKNFFGLDPNGVSIDMGSWAQTTVNEIRAGAKNTSTTQYWPPTNTTTNGPNSDGPDEWVGTAYVSCVVKRYKSVRKMIESAESVTRTAAAARCSSINSESDKKGAYYGNGRTSGSDGYIYTIYYQERYIADSTPVYYYRYNYDVRERRLVSGSRYIWTLKYQYRTRTYKAITLNPVAYTAESNPSVDPIVPTTVNATVTYNSY
jgi:hypothetical protein